MENRRFIECGNQGTIVWERCSSEVALVCDTDAAGTTALNRACFAAVTTWTVHAVHLAVRSNADAIVKTLSANVAKAHATFAAIAVVHAFAQTRAFTSLGQLISSWDANITVRGAGIRWKRVTEVEVARVVPKWNRTDASATAADFSGAGAVYLFFDAAPTLAVAVALTRVVRSATNVRVLSDWHTLTALFIALSTQSTVRITPAVTSAHASRHLLDPAELFCTDITADVIFTATVRRVHAALFTDTPDTLNIAAPVVTHVACRIHRSALATFGTSLSAETVWCVEVRPSTNAVVWTL